MNWPELLVGALLGAGGIGTAITQHILGRRRRAAELAALETDRAAQIDEITDRAHTQIYAAYGDLLSELRQQVELAQAQARAASALAHEANLRSLTAETRAAGAEARAAAAEAQVAEIRRLVRSHFPSSEELIRGLEQLLAREIGGTP